MVTILTYGALIGATVVAIGLIVWLVLRSSRPLLPSDDNADPEAPKPPGTFLGFTKSDWATGARWMRDQFASWFAGSFVLLLMFLLVCGGILLGMYFDGAYAERWAPTDGDKPQFRYYGYIVSAAMVILMSVSVLAFKKGAWLSGLITLIAGSYFFVLSLSQSVGFVTLKAEDMTLAADTFESGQTAQNNTRTALIAELRTQKSELDALINDEKETLTDEIGQYITDGRNNDDLADDSRARRNEIQDRRIAERDALNSRILCLTGDTTECTAEEKESAAAPVPTKPRRHDPVVEMLAFQIYGAEATRTQKDALTVRYMFFWSVGAPIIGLMLSVFLMITKHEVVPRSERKVSPWKTFKQKTWKERARFWEQIPNPDLDGVVEKQFSQDEWNWIQKAMNHRKNFEEGQAMKTPDFVKIENKEWLKAQKRDIVSLYETGLHPAEIADRRGVTLPEFEEWVRKFFKPSLADKIMRTDPSSKVNGTPNEGGENVAAPNS